MLITKEEWINLTILKLSSFYQRTIKSLERQAIQWEEIFQHIKEEKNRVCLEDLTDLEVGLTGTTRSGAWGRSVS